MPSREWKRKAKGMVWFPGETVITGIGQGAMLVTPLQLTNSTAALSQKGKRYRPYLVGAIDSSQTGFVREIVPEVVEEYEMKRDQNWVHIHNSMVNVVHGLRGTAQRIRRGLKYKVAGKTGTAQVFGIAQEEEYDEETVAQRLRDHALFISYAPAEDPQIAIAVIVENGGHGSSVAAPIARKVLDAFFQEPS